MPVARPLYETERHYIVAAPYGFDVYRNEGSAAVRCARIGFKGDEGMRRALAEIARREAQLPR